MNFEVAAIAYVRYVLGETHLSPNALASKAGISPSTLTRALNDPNHKFTLSMRTIERIANASGINPAPFLQAKDTADLNLGHLSHPEAYSEAIWGPGANSPPSRVTTLIGEVGAGIWKEPSVVRIGDYGPLALTSSYYPPEACFACFVRGESADMLARDGEILFCVRPEYAEKSIGRQSSPVIVERRSKDEFRVELTARFLRERRGGWELVSMATADQGAAKPKYFPTMPLEKETRKSEYRVVGYIYLVLREHTALANYFIFGKS